VLITVISLRQRERSEAIIMPMFLVNTNVAKSDIPPALLSEATDELAKAMGKPVQVSLPKLAQQSPPPLL
jgi:sirohydrochlorin ferrochelatase